MFTQKKGKYWCAQADIERGCQEFTHHVKDLQEFTHHVKDLSESYSDFDEDSTGGVVHWPHLPDEFLRWFRWILNIEYALGDGGDYAFGGGGDYALGDGGGGGVAHLS